LRVGEGKDKIAPFTIDHRAPRNESAWGHSGKDARLVYFYRGWKSPRYSTG